MIDWQTGGMWGKMPEPSKLAWMNTPDPPLQLANIRPLFNMRLTVRGSGFWTKKRTGLSEDKANQQ